MGSHHGFRGGEWRMGPPWLIDTYPSHTCSHQHVDRPTDLDRREVPLGRRDVEGGPAVPVALVGLGAGPDEALRSGTERKESKSVQHSVGHSIASLALTSVIL